MRNKRIVLYSFISVICTASCIVLFISLLSNVNALRKTDIFPEPEKRPAIREDAVWDAELGLYISGDLKKNEYGDYVINPDIFEPSNISSDTSPEALWLEAHRDSDDPIDRAILASVTAAVQEPASLHSALDPRTSDSIRTAMQALPVSTYPALWARACREPAYRPQKLTALEGFLAVPLNDLGLYDALAQRLWYERFTALKNDLPQGEMTAEDPARYGNLLLPLLADRLRGGLLTDAEEGIFRALVQGLGDNGYIPAEASAPVPDRAALLDWADRNAPLLDAIRAIIEAEYEWVGVRLQATRAQGLLNETDPGPR